MQRWTRALLLSLAVATVAPRALAQEQAHVVDLTWEAPAECPDGAHVEARVAALVGPRPPGQPTLTARARLTATKGSPRYRVEIAAAGAGAPRTLGGDDCARLAEAAALVLALDIDPEALTRREAPPASAPAPAASEPTPSPPPAVISPPPASAPPPRATARSSASIASIAPRLRVERGPSLEVRGGARAVFDGASLPRPTMGAGLAVDAALGFLATDLYALVFRPRFSVGGPRGGAAGAHVGLAVLGADACARAPMRALDLRACVGGEIGRMEARGAGISHPSSSASAVGAVVAGLSTRLWPRRPVSPVVGVSVRRPIGAPEVVIEGVGPVFSPPALVGRAFVGIEGRFL